MSCPRPSAFDADDMIGGSMQINRGKPREDLERAYAESEQKRVMLAHLLIALMQDRGRVRIEKATLQAIEQNTPGLSITADETHVTVTLQGGESPLQVPQPKMPANLRIVT